MYMSSKHRVTAKLTSGINSNLPFPHFSVRTPLVAISLQRYPLLSVLLATSSGPRPRFHTQVMCFQYLVNSLQLFATWVLCFQYFPHSFHQNARGWALHSKSSILADVIPESRGRMLLVKLLPLPRGNRKYRVLRKRHRKVALAVVPQDGIQDLVIGFVRMAPVHRGGCFRSRRGRGIALKNQPVAKVGVIRFKRLLRGGARKQQRHDRSVRVIVIHRWQAQQRLHGANHAYGGEEAALHIGMFRR